jgi:tryptophanyl-tRNA synthetase
MYSHVLSYQYLFYFEEDDEKLAKIYAQYRKGELLTGELKSMAIELLQTFVTAFQERRKQATDEILAQFMTPRRLEWTGNPNPNLEAKAKHVAALEAEAKKKKKKGKDTKGKDTKGGQKK